MHYGIIWWEEILPTIGGYLLYKSKSLELWLMHILETLVEDFLKN
jgi:hypothetical protein